MHPANDGARSARWLFVCPNQTGKGFSARHEGADAETHREELQQRLLKDAAPRPRLLLRRMKQDHLPGLPTREVHIHRQTMPPEQAARYQEVVDQCRDSDQRGAVLEALQKLRSVCLHPLHPEQGNSLPQEDYIRRSARLKATFDVLDEVQRTGRKALVFVELLAMQDWLADAIQRRYKLKDKPLLINGDVVGAERQRRVNEFQKRPNVFEVMILSPKAGGVGITLTEANHVIHLSRWWTPAVEDQCSDRVYRIGQTRPVHVHYPLAIHPTLGASSFDLTLDALLTRKRHQSRDFLAPAGAANEAELKRLFEETMGGAQAPSPPPALSLQDLDAMEPRAFERWAAHRLQMAGWEVRNPPLTRDGGVDVVAQRSGEQLLVQCKHTSTPEIAMDKGVSDLAPRPQGLWQGRVGPAEQCERVYQKYRGGRRRGIGTLDRP